MATSPPSYSTFSPYPSYPQPKHAQHPSFRSRKSSTIIPIVEPTVSEPPPPALPEHMRGPELQRTLSNSSTVSAAEEGEATPLPPDAEDEHAKWYDGPVFVAGVKLAGLFLVFTAVLVATFYWGIPRVDKSVFLLYLCWMVLIACRVDRPALKLPRSFADLQALKWVLFILHNTWLIFTSQCIVPEIQTPLSSAYPCLWRRHLSVVCTLNISRQG